MQAVLKYWQWDNRFTEVYNQQHLYITGIQQGEPEKIGGELYGITLNHRSNLQVKAAQKDEKYERNKNGTQ